MRGLKARLGIRLFNRTNRSVTLTPAGQALLSHITAGLSEISDGVEALNRYRDSIRSTTPEWPTDAARLVIAPIIARYVTLYPDVRLEITVEDTVVDIIEHGYDAGIHYGGTVPEDMIAVTLTP